MNGTDEGLLRAGAAYADAWISYQRERLDLPGVALAIWHGDGLLLASGHGHADLERGVAMTPGHIFRIASHSKTFTATAIAQLAERGALRLDDPLAAHLPWLPAALAGVTVRHALNHSAGIVRDGHDADYWQLDAPFPDDAGLRRMAEDAAAVLGTNETLKYSNVAYGLLGLVVEAASGLPYNDYVARHIVERLGLSHTGPDADTAPRGMVTGYTAPRLGLPRRPIPDVPARALAAATGFYSTAEDLCRYAAGHFFGVDVLLGDAMKREMQQPYWKVGQAEEHYGLGFSVIEVGERRLIGHGGAYPGHATRTLFDPRERLAVVVLINQIRGPADLLARSVVKILDFALRGARGAGVPAGAGSERFTGRFVNLWGVTDVVAFGDALVALSPEAEDPVAGAEHLTVEDAATLRVVKAPGYAAPGETLRYERDAAGHVTRVVDGGVSLYPLELYRERALGH